MGWMQSCIPLFSSFRKLLLYLCVEKKIKKKNKVELRGEPVVFSASLY